MTDLLAHVRGRLAPAANAWLDEAIARCAREGKAAVGAVLPGLPRRIGRHRTGGGIRELGAGRVDLDAWRACDVAARTLLEPLDDAAVLDLFAHGDIEERTMVLRAASVRPLSGATAALLGEVQRSNTLPHFEALVCDSDLLARACGGVAGFEQAETNRMLLKAAFLGLPLARLFDIERHANAELSRMLQDLATEREAAGRAVWPDTITLMARAPVPGTAARVLGELEHGDDERRARAIAALGMMRRADLVPFVRERLPREPRGNLRHALEALVGPQAEARS